MDNQIQTFTSFSEQSNLFVSCTSDKKLKVFNIISNKSDSKVLNKEFLKTSVTCIDIAKNKDKAYIVIGNSDGRILVVDSKTLLTINNFKFHDSQILDIKIDSDSSYIYSISSDRKLIKIDLSLGEIICQKELKKKGSLEKGLIHLTQNSIICNYDTKVVVFDLNGAILNDIVQFNQINKLTGNNKSLTQMSVAGNYLSCFSEEGYINIFELSKENSVFNIDFSQDSQLRNLSFQKLNEQVFILGALSESSFTLYILNLQNSQFQLQQQQSIKFSANFVLYTSFTLQQDIFLVFGSLLNLKFANQQISQNKKQFKSIQLSNLLEQVSSLLNSYQSKVQVKNGQLNPAQVTAQAYVLNENDQKPINLNQPEQTEQEKTIYTSEVLELIKKIKQAKLNEAQNQENPEISSVESLAVVLLQALHNNDKQLIDFCLEKEDEILIDNTVSQLLPGKVSKLIEAVSSRLSAYPFQAPVLGKWLKALFRHHSTILASTPEIQETLKPLNALINNRTKNLDKILLLRGKIDLILGGDRLKKLNLKEKKSQIPLDEKLVPLHVYQDKASDVVQVEQINNKYKNSLQNKKKYSDSVSSSEAEEDEEFEEEEEDQDIEEEEYEEAVRSKKQQAIDKMYQEENDEDEQDSNSEYMQLEK